MFHSRIRCQELRPFQFCYLLITQRIMPHFSLQHLKTSMYFKALTGALKKRSRKTATTASPCRFFAAIRAAWAGQNYFSFFSITCHSLLNLWSQGEWTVPPTRLYPLTPAKWHLQCIPQASHPKGGCEPPPSWRWPHWGQTFPFARLSSMRPSLLPEEGSRLNTVT